MEQAVDTSLVRELCKKLEVDYIQFPMIWAEKFRWHRQMWNESDTLGLAQRVCKDVANIVLSEPVKFWTQSEQINQLIEMEIKGRLNFDEIFGKQLTMCMGLGDMVMVVYPDPLDGRPAINYITGQNIIPITYNNHTCSSLAWFQKDKVDESIYVTVGIEKQFSRQIFLFKYDGGSLMMMDTGSPIWIRILGNTRPMQEWNEEYPYRRFAWISTGLNSPRWHDTPFHNSFIWPTQYLDRIKKDWDFANDEMDKSVKKVFLSPELIRKSVTSTDDNGFALNVKKADMTGGIFESVDLSEDQIKEWVPNIRIAECTSKISLNLKMFTTAVGLGSDFYSFDYPKIEMTATQALLTHSDCFRTINNIKYGLKNALQTIIFAFIQEWYKEGLIDDEEYELIINQQSIDVIFDDGVFVDRGKEIELGLQVLAGASTIAGMRNIDQYTFLTDFCKYSKERALDIMNRTFNEYQQNMMLQLGLLMNGGKD